MPHERQTIVAGMQSGHAPPVPSVLPSLYASLILQSVRRLDTLMMAWNTQHMHHIAAVVTEQQHLSDLMYV